MYSMQPLLLGFWACHTATFRVQGLPANVSFLVFGFSSGTFRASLQGSWLICRVQGLFSRFRVYLQGSRLIYRVQGLFTGFRAYSRDRERQRETERGRERQREAERGRERQREAERGRERQREAERGRERQREAERGRERQREAERGRLPSPIGVSEEPQSEIGHDCKKETKSTPPGLEP